jgi:hypothetical protein
MPLERRILARLRSKLVRLRLVARDWVRRGGDPHDVLVWMAAIQTRLRRRQLLAAEHEMDAAMARLRKDPALRGVDLPAA